MTRYGHSAMPKKGMSPQNYKGKLGYGDVWTFVAIDSENKLVLSWHVGWREPEDAYEFTKDVQRTLSNRVQLTTDGHKECTMRP